MATLAQRLGFDAEAKLLIITCDDLGTSHSANLGCYQALHAGLATSTSLIVPAPWARHAASSYRGEDVGVHLTLNSEFDLYRWGPVTQAPSLLDGDGGFPRTVADVWDHADLDEVRRELTAQLERATLWGLAVTHLSSHLDVLALRPEFFDIYLDLAVDHCLPIRLDGQTAEASVGFPFKTLAAEAGIISPDQVLRTHSPGSRYETEPTAQLRSQLTELTPGVTELRIHPAVDSAELKAFAGDWQQRTDDLATMLDGSMHEAIEAAGAELIGYSLLTELQRDG